MREQAPGESRERERVGAQRHAADRIEEREQRREVQELDVARVRAEAGFLRCDQKQLAARAQLREPLRHELACIGPRQVFEHVREEQRVEGLRGFGRREKRVGQEGPKAASARDLDRVRVVIDANGRRTERRKVAPDPAADFECAAERQAPQVEPVGPLDVEPALPARTGETLEAIGVSGISGIARRLHAGDCSLRAAMSTAARITFAIPFHRGLAYLRETIESVRAQRVSAWCCIVLDDRGESEGVADLVASFGDARIAYHDNQTTLGIVGNWNRGLDLATTELVTLLHADDRLLPEYCDVIFALSDTHPRAVALCCDAEIIDAQGRPRFSLADAVKRRLVPNGEPWRIEGESGLRALARADFVMCPTVAWRRERLGARRFEAGLKQAQDLEMLARLLLDGETIAGTRRRAYAYRRHAESATAVQTKDLSRFEEEVAVLDRIAAGAREQGFPSAARVAERKMIVRLHLAVRIAADLASLRGPAALHKLRFLARLGGERGRSSK